MPELGGAEAVEVEHLVEAAVLLVRADVLQSRQSLHLRQHDGTPPGEVLDVVGLQRVLVHGVARPAADAQVLRRLQER
jgi:hypothetical protein